MARFEIPAGWTREYAGGSCRAYNLREILLLIRCR